VQASELHVVNITGFVTVALHLNMNMNMNLFNHNNNSADDYVQLNSCGC